jgi:CheY-specific phosphatase CheX
MDEIELLISKSDEYADLLCQAVETTFENLIFCEIERVEQDFVLYGNFLSVEVTEPFKGEFIASVPKPLAAEIASTVLGVEADMLTDALFEDASGEVLNTIAGNFLRAIIPAGGQFNLGLPKPVKGSDVAETHAVSRHFRIGEEILAVALRF